MSSPNLSLTRHFPQFLWIRLELLVPGSFFKCLDVHWDGHSFRTFSWKHLGQSWTRADLTDSYLIWEKHYHVACPNLLQCNRPPAQSPLLVSHLLYTCHKRFGSTNLPLARVLYKHRIDTHTHTHKHKYIHMCVLFKYIYMIMHMYIYMIYWSDL